MGKLLKSSEEATCKENRIESCLAGPEGASIPSTLDEVADAPIRLLRPDERKDFMEVPPRATGWRNPLHHGHGYSQWLASLGQEPPLIESCY